MLIKLPEGFASVLEFFANKPPDAGFESVLLDPNKPPEGFESPPDALFPNKFPVLGFESPEFDPNSPPPELFFASSLFPPILKLNLFAQHVQRR